MENLDLQEIRGQLDEIDSRLVELVEKRMELCQDVAEFKIRTGKPVYDPRREKEKLDAVMDMAAGDFNKKSMCGIFTQLMTISRRLQYRLLARKGLGPDTGFTMVEELKREGARIVYQGVKGAYSHGAAMQFFGADADMYHVASFEDAMVEVEEHRADYAVLPIENSTAGAVSGNYDNLVKHNLYIVGETQVSVTHALLGLKGAKIQDIRRVYSHPQALMQCSGFLNRNRQWTQYSVENTAGAAKKILEDQDMAQAAVASETAGRIYGLQVLEKAINQEKDNTTRFIILSSQPEYCRGADKVSISFEGLHKTGSLYNMLGHFLYNDVNMLMIESRPIEGRSWEYRFFVDVEGSLGDASIQNALKGISEEAVSMRILGNY